MTKNILIMFVLLTVIGCGQTLKIVWDANPVSDQISHYEIYVCETQDTVGFVLDSLTIVHHNPLLTQYKYTYTFQDTMYIKVGIVAVDSLTRRSEMAVTRFYGFPSEVETVEIKQ